MQAAMNCIPRFFTLPLSDKLKARGNPLCRNWGYAGAGAHSDRFTANLPWKETLSFGSDSASSDSMVADYFVSTLGDGFREMGAVYQKYCEAMMKLALSIMELLGMSLGVDRAHFREFFGDGNSIMRLNYYPPCQEPELTFGTGPHCDPTSITILLQQDEVDGLEVFSRGEWRVVRPARGALIVNIGDTFMVTHISLINLCLFLLLHEIYVLYRANNALTNGMYKSCLHRAVVNKVKERSSLAFFLCPRINRVVRPPECLVNEENPRKYPDFTWAELFDFTQKHYRADMETLPTFTHWLLSSSRSHYSHPSPP
ncbi:Gibberellin 20 oxidase 2 [Platanthera zijinensis]|uniref:Gibberellin 20 oxidase 2 n=1 Tax=Platanthera zijinensis TaxID=2320716 RepID=A0AAP0FUL0_9ASPA